MGHPSQLVDFLSFPSICAMSSIICACSSHHGAWQVDNTGNDGRNSCYTACYSLTKASYSNLASSELAFLIMSMVACELLEDSFQKEDNQWSLAIAKASYCPSSVILLLCFVFQ